MPWQKSGATHVARREKREPAVIACLPHHVERRVHHLAEEHLSVGLQAVSEPLACEEGKSHVFGPDAEVSRLSAGLLRLLGRRGRGRHLRKSLFVLQQ